MELKMVYDYYWKNPRSEAFGSECVEIMDTLEIDNPYEICFAFLYLLDSGNDLPWFHMASYAVVSKAAVMLPWGQMFDAYDNCWDEDDDETYFDESEEEPEDSQYDPAEEKKEYKQYLENPPDLIDREKEIYRQKYRRIDDEWRKEHLGVESENCNLPQFVFELSNVVLPRDPRFSGCDAREFTESGFSEDEAGILLYLNTLANESKYRDYDWSDYLFSDYSVEEEEDDQEDKGEEVELEALKKQNKAYKSELDRLRSQIHDLQKEKKTAENETAKIREENALEHQELVDLREAIFNWEHGEQETAEEISIELPYETKTRMIVFGGHDSWIKAIRPMLPDVRFVDKDMIPKAETIRNAGIVWIQPNAISHAYYYKIMDIVRQHKIPVRYFTNASAEKCARQLAMADIKNRQ